MGTRYPDVTWLLEGGGTGIGESDCRLFILKVNLIGDRVTCDLEFRQSGTIAALKSLH